MWRIDSDVQPDQTLHVWPDGDLTEHDIYGGPCACGPLLEEQASGVVLVVHHSLDGRERYEG